MLAWRPLAALGLISYGVYLYHWPLDIVLDEQRVGLRGWPLFFVQTLVTLVVATVSYRLVEQPIRRGAFTAHQWRTYLPVAATALVAALVVTTTLGARSEPPPLRAGTALRKATRAAKGARKGSTRVMIVGNSIGQYLALYGFDKIKDDVRPRLTVLDATVPGCYFPPQLQGVVFKAKDGSTVPLLPCAQPWEAPVVRRFKPDVVFWLVGVFGILNASYRGRPARACGEPYDLLYRRSLTREVGVLGATGARVIIATGGYPRLPDVANRDRLVDCENRVRRSVAAATKADLVDLGAYTCPDRQCPAQRDGVTLRPDGFHYQGAGARVVARWLMDQVERRPPPGHAPLAH